MASNQPWAKKSLGQHFLHDERILARIARLARPQPGSGLVEIGPGTGNLTAHLLEHGVPLVAIERDRRMLSVLEQRFDDQLEVLCGDAARFDFASLLDRDEMGPAPLVVGNLPYNAAVPILFRLLDCRVRPRRIVAMFQREVAQRLVAEPSTSAYGQLSVKMQMRTDVRIVLKVGRGAFTPAPKVQSAVVMIDPLTELRYDVPDEGRFYELVEAGFNQRRKTLSRALHNKLRMDVTVVKRALVEIGQEQRVRAEALSPEQWAKLARVLDPSPGKEAT